ncbi:cysteine protease ATG4 [Rhodotorula paludigena]|uniref:cysteine protease ATG4 n=1 Tax=Rhodotorula paludigena TaxID=86838 RepID=UPI003176EFD8
MPLPALAPDAPRRASPPHPSGPRSSPPAKLVRSRSANSLALFTTASSPQERGASPPAPVAIPLPPADSSHDGIRLVGSYDSSDGASSALSPSSPYQSISPPAPALPASRSPDDALLSPTQQHQQPNKLTKWLSRGSPSGSSSPEERALPESPTKSRKTRSRSIGSLNLLTRSLNGGSACPSAEPGPCPPAPSALVAPAPIISISSSPSDHFSPSSPLPASTASSSQSSSPSLAAQQQPQLDPLRRSSATSTSSTASSSARRSAFPNLSSLKPGSSKAVGAPVRDRKRSLRRARPIAATADPTSPALLDDDWATADLESGDEDGRLISEAMVRAARATRAGTSSSAASRRSSSIASTSTGTGASSSVGSGNGSGAGAGAAAGEGRLARGLRKTRSGLRLFGKAKEQASMVVVGGGEGGGGAALDLHSGGARSASTGSDSAFEVASAESPAASVTPTSSAFPSSSSGPSPLNASSGSSPAREPAPPSQPAAPLSPSSNVANRIGGWFSSMLHTSSSGATSSSSSSVHLPLPSPSTEDAAFVPSSPDKARSTASSRAPGSSSSPAAASRTSASMGAPSSSPLKKGSSSSSAAVGGRLGPLDRMLDRAVQYFLDTDSQADRCEDDIWVLGVRHVGWRLEEEPHEDGADGAEEGEVGGEKDWKRRSLPGLGRKRGSPTKQRKAAPAPPPPPLPAAPTSTSDDPFLAPSTSAAASVGSPSPTAPVPPAAPPTTINGWPANFYHDFYSRIALTYRSNFPVIPCDPSSSSSAGTGVVQGMLSNLSMSIGRGVHRGAAAQPATGAGAGSAAATAAGLSSDAGWGCMLRTGQSLLANALTKVHLGRDWRRPLAPAATTSAVPSAATYARLLSLFLDDPSPVSPFSVHRFALEGKRLGKEVGEWFGPSTAAGAIKTLVNAYEPAGLRVVSCVDGAVYGSEVAAASAVDGEEWKKPVLVLVNLRLGIDGVNPIYHEAIKGIFRFPQSVGIAGGRPSSSYYFVGAQANSLFYIDPHHPRPAIRLVLPSEPALVDAAQSIPLAPSSVPDNLAMQLDSFLLSAYPDAAWATYHCDRVRKCALTSLDPSMLLGFVIEDERDWTDFVGRVKELSASSAPIFSIASSPPSWMRRSTTSATIPARPSATPAANSAADDSYTDLGSSGDDADSSGFTAGGRGPDGGEGASGGGSSVGFSEPDDWELQSTDGEVDEAAEPSGPSGTGEAPQHDRPIGEGTSPLGEPPVVVSPSLAPTAPREAVDEGWQGVEAERSS